jgi:hypothetical protein
LLLEAIAAGELDLHLPAIARAIAARLHLLHTTRSIHALAELRGIAEFSPRVGQLHALSCHSSE